MVTVSAVRESADSAVLGQAAKGTGFAAVSLLA